MILPFFNYGSVPEYDIKYDPNPHKGTRRWNSHAKSIHREIATGKRRKLNKIAKASRKKNRSK